MDISGLRLKVRILIVGIFGLLSTFLIIRLFLIVIGASENSSFVRFWYNDLTQPIVNTFVGVYPDWFFGELRIETASILGIMVYIIVGLVIAKFIGTFIENNPKNLLINLIDSFFKIAEFLLIFRFLLRLTGASSNGGFTRAIMDFSAIVYEPFAGLLPTLRFGNADELIFETSTLIAIIIIIVLDIVSESILKGLLSSDKSNHNDYNPFGQPMQPYVPMQSANNTPQTTHVNINIPQAQSQPVYTQYPQGEPPFRQTIQMNEMSDWNPGQGQNYNSPNQLPPSS